MKSIFTCRQLSNRKYAIRERVSNPIRIFAILFSFGLLFYSSNTFAQAVSPGISPVVPPTGQFHIEGNLKANIPLAGVGDWIPNVALDGGVLSATGVAPTPSTKTFHKIDLFTAQDNTFEGGLKKDGILNDYKWKTAKTSPAKCDINHLLVHIGEDPTTGDTWITLSGDRAAVNGNSFISIALHQKLVAALADGTFSSQAPRTTGGRTVGDVQISAEFTGGGVNPNLYLEEWKNVSGVYKWVSFSISPMPALGSTNAGILSDLPYTAFNKSTYEENAFIEVSFNISAIYRGTSTPCVGSIASMFVMTKSSQSVTADLADFVDPLQINLDINVGAPTAPGATYCVGQTIANLSASGESGATFKWYTSVTGNGVPTGTPTTGATFTPSIDNSIAGVYNYYVTQTISGCESQPRTVTITVNALPTITGTLSVCEGLTTQLNGSASPAAVNPWTSSNTGVATVSATGLVTGVSAGTSTITYTNSNNCQRTATVTVNALPTISGTLSVCVGLTTQLTGSASPAASNAWVSSNTAVATISSTGLVTGVTAGTTTITYTNSNGCSQTATITVNALPTISGTLSVCVGLTTQLTGSGTAAASNAWVSSNTAVATISATGLLTGVAAGNSTITYTNSNGCSQTATVTVNPLPTISGTLSVCVGLTTQLTGSASPAASNAWVSSNTAVATISSTGLVTGVGAGTTTITYTNSNGCQRTASVTVNALPTINGTLSVCVGSTTQLTGSATAAASNAWVSSNTAVATISATGLVTGVSAGTATITYTNSNGCSQTETVTVNALPLAPTLNVVQPTCSNSNGSVTVTNPTGVDFVYSNNDGAFQAGTSFTVASNAAYSIKVKRVSTGCISGATTGTMGNSVATPAAAVVFVTNPSCSSSTGTLRVVMAGPPTAEYDNTIFEFSNDGTTFVSNPVFPFTAGEGYTITVRRKSDHTCTATASCEGEAGRSQAKPLQQPTDLSRRVAPVVDLSSYSQTSVSAYPNPFNDRLKFVINTPVSGNGTLEIYNMMGQKIKTVYQGYLSSGLNSFDLNLKGQKSSSLIYKFKMGEKQVTGKLLQITQ